MYFTFKTQEISISNDIHKAIQIIQLKTELSREGFEHPSLRIVFRSAKALFGKAYKHRHYVSFDTSGSIRNSCRNTLLFSENYYTTTLRSRTAAY